MDNGYMLFNHFRVPRSAMLSRYAEVSDETGASVYQRMIPYEEQSSKPTMIP